MQTGSPLSLSQAGWTTGRSRTTEWSSATSHSYSLDFSLDDNECEGVVNQHFEQFASMLFEGSTGTLSSAYKGSRDWVAQFPHLRVLGKQVVSPADAGWQLVPSTTPSTSPRDSLTPRPSTSGTLEPDKQDSDTLGLTVSGRKVSASSAPPEALSLLSRDRRKLSTPSEFDFLHEDVFAQDGVYQDIIAIDFKTIFEDTNEDKKQITPRRRRVGYPPITPNACVKDSVLGEAFDSQWVEVMSWLQSLWKRLASEAEAKKMAAACGLGNPRVQTANRGSQPTRKSQSVDARTRLNDNGMLSISRKEIVNRNTFGGTADAPDSGAVRKLSTGRSGKVRQGLVLLPPLTEHGTHGTAPSGQLNTLMVSRIIPTRLHTPPATPASRLPLAESSLVRASTAIDLKVDFDVGRVRIREQGGTTGQRPSTVRPTSRTNWVSVYLSPGQNLIPEGFYDNYVAKKKSDAAIRWRAQQKADEQKIRDRENTRLRQQKRSLHGPFRSQ